MNKTRRDIERRLKATAAGKKLGLSARENLVMLQNVWIAHMLLNFQPKVKHSLRQSPSVSIAVADLGK